MRTRREFLTGAVAGPLAGLAVLSAACGDDGGGVSVDAAEPSCLTNGTSVVITGNHGHVLMVTVADIQAAADLTYDIGGGDHTHSVTLTQQHFRLLASNQPVMVRSTTDLGHSHPITVRCA